MANTRTKTNHWKSVVAVLAAAVALGAPGCATSSLRTGEIAHTFVAEPKDDQVLPVVREAENKGEVIKKGDSFVVALRQIYLRYLGDPGFPNEVLVVVSVDDGSPAPKTKALGIFEKVRDSHKLNFRDTVIYEAEDFQGPRLGIGIEIYEVDAPTFGGKKFYEMMKELARISSNVDVLSNKADVNVALLGDDITEVLRKMNEDDIEFRYSMTFQMDAEPHLREGTYVCVKREYKPRALDKHINFLTGVATLFYARGDIPDEAAWEPIDPSELRVYDGEVLRTLTPEEQKRRDPNYQPSWWEETRDFVVGFFRPKEPSADYVKYDGYKEYRDKTHVVFTIRKRGK